jgi:microcystin-dependent protein
MAAAPTRISELTQVTPVGTDQIPIARGFGAGGQTLKITVDSLTKKNSTDIDDLSGRTISVVDSPTIDLTYNSSTRQLSADLQMNLDLRSRTILLPSFIEIPPGCIMPFAGTAAPDGWVICNGDIVPNGVGPVQGKNYNFSRLWTVLGTTYGATPGTLPDLRGYFIRGYGSSTDPSVGANADGTESGAFGQKVADTFQGHKHGIYDPQHNHGITDPTHGHTGAADSAGAHHHNINNPLVNDESVATCGIKEGDSGSTADCGGLSTDSAGAHTHTVTINNNSTGITINNNSTGVLVQNPTIDSADTGSIAGPSASRAPSTSFETKPRNMALLYCIKV